MRASVSWLGAVSICEILNAVDFGVLIAAWELWRKLQFSARPTYLCNRLQGNGFGGELCCRYRICLEFPRGRLPSRRSAQ